MSDGTSDAAHDAADQPSADPAAPPDAGAPVATPSTGRRRRRRADRFDSARALTLALGIAGGLVLAQLVTATAARLRAC